MQHRSAWKFLSVALLVVALLVSLAVERPETYRDVEAGESIAVSGVCLTALPVDGSLKFDVSPATVAKVKNWNQFVASSLPEIQQTNQATISATT